MTKTCTRCGIEKPLAAFNRRVASFDGLQSRCRACISIQSAIYRASNPEKIAAQKAAYYAANRSKVCRTVAAYRTNNPEKVAASKRKYTYGLTQTQYEELLITQNGRCAVCGDAFENTAPHVDHSHTTNRVRGLLCGRCNKGIGHLRDDPHLCRNAAAYLVQNGVFTAPDGTLYE